MAAQSSTTSDDPHDHELSSLSIFDLLDFNKPWILVKNGSFRGYFDWMPQHLRVGPWKLIPLLYLACIVYTLALLSILALSNPPQGGWTSQLVSTHSYEAGTTSWFINIIGFLWTSFICWHIVAKSPAGYAAIVTYTVQSWFCMTLRFGFCVLAPYSTLATILAESLRFQILMSACITSLVWNVALLPAIALFLPAGPQRKRFLGYMFSFRLMQLHVFNIVYAIATGALTYPQRSLETVDYCIGVTFTLAYFAWYYLVMDRLGVHVYGIFSPRQTIVVVLWTLVFCLYGILSVFWTWFLDDTRKPLVVVIGM